MKKSSFIAIVLAAAVMLIGAGYAAWTETLTITNTISTGNVDVDMNNGFVAVYQDDSAATADGLPRTATATASDQAATVKITNLYPGAKAVVTIPVTNNSTIPVKDNGVTVTGAPDWATVIADSPDSLDVDETGDIILTITVAESAPEDISDISFTATANYIQWNAN